MKNLLIAVSALALATPALAQTQPSATTSQPSTTAQPSTTSPSTATQSAPVDQTAPADAATPQTETAATTATPSDPKALIASEFPAYDKDSSGTLDKTEFAAWMAALKAKTDTTPTPAAELTKWTDGAFTTADKDKSKTITLAELQTYLTAGA